MKKRPLIGILTARVAAPEQKQLLEGILERANELGLDTAIFSNLYNFDKYFAGTEIENRIYDLIPSPRIDGLILTAESILNPQLQQYIYKRMCLQNVPLVTAGAEIPGIDCVNTDVQSDFEDIARHLTEVHHFTEIDMLTGQKEQPTSLLRLQGLKNGLAEKGILLPEENIIYGNFWNNTGEDLAMEYITGKRRFPEVIVCANDYMAYGVCDAFLAHGVRVPEDVAVIGYEYVGNRMFHAPLLTTYHRNRPAVGRLAVEKLYCMMTGNTPEDISVSGRMICGDTCSCGVDRKQLNAELEELRQTNFYIQLNFQGNFEQQLTVCRSINDYIRVLQDYAYLIRNAAGVYLCLYEDWSSGGSDVGLGTQNPDAAMLCYRIISPVEGNTQPHFFRRSQLFPDSLSFGKERGFLYFAPIIFAGRELGHFIIKYDQPDSYDAVFGDWLKIAANGLEALRMKNDLRTLLECRNLSEHRDTTTGLYNRAGITNEVHLALQEAAEEDSLILVIVRTALFSDDTSLDSRNIAVRTDVQIAECLKKLTIGTHEFCAKISDKLYAAACIGTYDEGRDTLLQDKLETLILHAPLYSEHQGLGSLVCAAVQIPAKGAQAETEARHLYTALQTHTETIAAARNHISYPEYHSLRSAMYCEPQKDWNAQDICRQFHLSYGHFRATYKELFGISFHQDVIQSRISLAKYLLLTTSLSLQAIAFQCGYEDDKYFLRQFRKLTGFTPNYYRNA